MQLSSMWMLKHLLLGRETTVARRDQRHPNLIIHSLIRRDSSLAIDISIANPFSWVGGSNPRPLAAALNRETDKTNKYAADCSKLSLAFHPPVMDAYVGIPPKTVQYVLNTFIHRAKNFVPQNWAAPTQLKPLVPEALCDTLDIQCLQGKATVRHLLRKMPPSTPTITTLSS